MGDREDLGDALDLCTQALARARTIGDLGAQADLLFILEVLALKTGRLPEAQVYLRETADLATHLKEVEAFAENAFASAKATFPNFDPTTLKTASDILGIPADLLQSWKFDPDINGGTNYLTTLLRAEGYAKWKAAA